MQELIFKSTNTILRPVSLHRTLFVFLFLISNTIGIIGNNVGVPSNYFLNFLLGIFDIYVCCLIVWGICSLIKKHSRFVKGVRWLLYLLFSYIFVVELFVVLFYHSSFSVHVMELIMQTNSKESLEFLVTTFTTSALWITLGVTVILILVTKLITIGYARLIPKRAGKTIRYVMLLLILWSGIRQIPAYGTIIGCFNSGSVSYCSVAREDLQLNTTLTRFCFDSAYHKASLRELKVLEKTLAESKVTGCDYMCPLIVLIIGESYNKYHSHLYNKEYLDNTPNLDRMEKEGNLVKYTDVITPYNLTSEVFKHLFTMNDGIGGDWSHHSFFTALFKKAGYNVYFVTNQFVPESNDDWDAIGGTFLNNKQLSDLQFTWRNTKRHYYDGDMLSEIPDMKRILDKPTLLIVHLLGQHTEYEQRYPKEFNKFKHSDSKTIFGGEDGKVMEAFYANATLYNDYVVNRIFSMFKDHDAIGIYFSDHGEEVYDGRDLYFRTQERPIPKDIMPYQYEVPAMFYLSDSFKENHPDVAERIFSSKDLPAENVNLSHTLVWLGGIETPEYNSKLDVLSPEYDRNRCRMIWGDTPYIKTKTF